MDELLKFTEFFLTSSTILIGGFSLARTEPLKTGLSLLGSVMTVLWLLCSIDANIGPQSMRTTIIVFILPILFLVGWVISAVVHARLWRAEQLAASTVNQSAAPAPTSKERDNVA